MRISRQARRDAKALFRSCLVNGVLDEHRVRQTVQQVIALKPRGFIAILTHFQRLVSLDVDRHTAHIETAAALPPELQANIQATLARQYGPGLRFVYQQNPALLGGLRIKVGSDVYDGSVHGRLRQLEQAVLQ